MRHFHRVIFEILVSQFHYKKDMHMPRDRVPSSKSSKVVLTNQIEGEGAKRMIESIVIVIEQSSSRLIYGKGHVFGAV